MPLLELETSVYPDDLFQSQPASGCWWVLHTRPRAEKNLVRKLLRDGCAFFLPLHERQWLSTGRLLRSYLPLFPSYVFLHGDPYARLVALKTNLVVNVLPVEDQAQLHADLVRVHQLIASGSLLTPEDRLQPGSKVEITSGSLAGLEGKILRRGKKTKFLVEVQFLQRGVSVELESWMFEPSNDPVFSSPCNGDNARRLGQL